MIRSTSNRAHVLAFVAFAVWQFRLIGDEYDNRKSKQQLEQFYILREKRQQEELLKEKKDDEEVKKMVLV